MPGVVGQVSSAFAPLYTGGGRLDPKWEASRTLFPIFVGINDLDHWNPATTFPVNYMKHRDDVFVQYTSPIDVVSLGFGELPHHSSHKDSFIAIALLQRRPQLRRLQRPPPGPRSRRPRPPENRNRRLQLAAPRHGLRPHQQAQRRHHLARRHERAVHRCLRQQRPVRPDQRLQGVECRLSILCKELAEAAEHDIQGPELCVCGQ